MEYKEATSPEKKTLLSSIISGGGKFKLDEFVAEIQGFCLGLRLTHWETKSYELHKAVEMTQASLEGSLDDFVEACLGFMGGSRTTFKKEIEATTNEDAIIACLNGMSVKDTSLLNIRDEMLAAVNKFKYLKTLV